MPVHAPRICKCGKAISSGVICKCVARDNHARKARFDKKRPNSTDRGYDRAWEAEAKAFLARPENRVCVCGAPATVVMHRKSIRLRPDLRMDRTNWSPGCQRCNAKQAAQERRSERKPS